MSEQDHSDLSTEEERAFGESRRDFLRKVSVAGVGLLALQFVDGTEVFAEVPEYVTNPVDPVPLRLSVNGADRAVSIDARTSLLDTLREHLDLTGSKKGCDHGQCGACTVIIDGKRQLSCLTLAVMCDGKKVTTIEGLASGDKLHPMQQAFLDHDGFQCGYCTPGQICSAVAMLAEAKKGDVSQVTDLKGRPADLKLTDEEIRERMAGNLCRCGAYPNIVDAIKEVHAGEDVRMKPFTFVRAKDQNDAVRLLQTDGRFIAGGTNLVDLMKEGVANPSQLVDIQRLPLTAIQANRTGGVSLGALAKNTETANHPLIRSQYPLLTQAILAGASPQIRNMATNGGNLVQRTRCAYFYDVAMPCNKREPGSGCGAFEGLNKNHAILGWSETCVATFPSDMCVALSALDAKVNVLGKDGKERVIDFADFHRLPGTDATKDNNLNTGDLILSIELPKAAPSRSHYLKLRNRASYAFALVSVAAIFETQGGRIANPRIALGGVAHKPWRAVEAEKFLAGKPATADNFKQAAELALKDAKALSHNGYKVTMAKRAIVRALTVANTK